MWPSRCAGAVATACTNGERAQHGKPQCVVRDEQPEAREGQTGRLGWRRGSVYRGSRVMPVEGRNLSSRWTQHVVRDLEIGQPINCEECSETADGVPSEPSITTRALRERGFAVAVR